MSVIFNFTNEELEYIVDILTNNKPKKLDKIALYSKIDLNMELFLKECNTKEKFQKFRKNLNKNQSQIFRYIVGISKIKIPNEYYN